MAHATVHQLVPRRDETRPPAPPEGATVIPITEGTEEATCLRCGSPIVVRFVGAARDETCIVCDGEVGDDV